MPVATKVCGLVEGTDYTDMTESERGQFPFKASLCVLKGFTGCMMEGFQKEVQLRESLGFGLVASREGKYHEVPSWSSDN